MTDREKNAEILVLRHQITVLEGQLDAARVRFAGADRVLSPFQPEAAGWRSMPEGRQALLVLVHLRRNETFAALAAAFGIGVSPESDPATRLACRAASRKQLGSRSRRPRLTLRL
ncbi:transposase family protein [Actinomadura luteofluorescens]|uniref:transposase family protein n=1 Tax=Actinomadura luteofluorescens TaxID=46163 RepID=UPI003D8F305E